MSHFTVLVIGENVEDLLQPYHEYECTGTDDEYVIEINKDEDVKEYLNREIFVGKNKETGKVDYHYYEEKANETLVDWKKITQQEHLASVDIDHEIKSYFGYYKKADGSWYTKTNPNSKWDWWVIGGRWSGFLKKKKNAKGKLGKPGSFNNKPIEGGADVILKGNVDWEGMRDEAKKPAIKRWKLINKVIKSTPEHESYESIFERLKDPKTTREFYWNQERLEAFRKVTSEHDDLFGIFASIEDYLCDEETYVSRAMNSAVSTYAVIKDGKWYEKGKMGWFGMGSNEMSEDEWNAEFWKIIQSTPDDALLTLVDCHI